MTEWLVRTFVRDADNTSSAAVRSGYGRLSSVTCIVLNVLLCLSKGMVGVVVGSVSIVADAINNLSDASSNVVSLIGFKLASRPADEGHPYGHGRYEYLAGMVVAVLVVAVGVQLARSSVERILAPQAPGLDLVTVGILLLSIVVKLWMARFNRSLARRIGSGVLEATAVDSRNDVIATSAVLLASLASAASGRDLDGWAGLAVAAFIVASGIGLLRDTVDPLMGQTPSAELVQRVYERIMSYPGVLGTHDLLIHDYGPGRQFASAHVEMAADATVRQSHLVLDQIERELLQDEHLRIILHCDPIETEVGSDDLRNWVSGELAGLDRRLSVHDVDFWRDRGLMRVRLDCRKPDGVDISDDELRQAVEAIVRRRVPGADVELTIDTGYVSPASEE